MRPNDSTEIIEFNVGGSTYTTSKTTITSYPDSMLCRMISGSIPTATDNQQRIFIDRDGPLFRYILNFLRDKCLNLPEHFTEYAQLRQEADFYRIEPIINHLDNFFHKKLSIHNKLISSSNTSLNSTSDSNVTTNKGYYFTVISKLYQGTIESLIGCIRILSAFSSLDSNSKRFMNSLMNPPNNPNNGNNNSGLNNTLPNLTAFNLLDCFVCECKFMHEEKIICCKPCGLNGGTDNSFLNLSQSVMRLAKRFGITTGYWEDMFYLTLDNGVPNRELLCSILTEKYNAKLISSSVCDRRSSYDDNSTCSLVERWQINDVNNLRS